jgi:Sensors of blue-light using FAD
MLVRCLYASRAATPTSSDVLDRILSQSRKNNPTLGLTGMLCFANGIFVQVLEGGRDEVSRLYNAIARDERHQDVQLLMYEEILERRFGDWTMGQVNVDRVNPALLLKYGKKAELDPFGTSGQVTMALLLELAASGSIVNRKN